MSKLKQHLASKFTHDEDKRLVKFVSTYSVGGGNRKSSKMYEVLGPQASEELAWSRHKPTKAWMDRYCQYASTFDDAIDKYERQLRRPGPRPVAPPRDKTREAAQQDKGSRGSCGTLPTTEKTIHAVQTTEILSSSSPGTPARKPYPIPSPTEPSPPPANAPSSPINAATASAVHKKLAKMARKTMFSVDFVWGVYTTTGSVELTREALAEITEMTEAAVYASEPGNGKRGRDGVEERQTHKQRKIRH
ncbi:hypothetical protein DFH09DRAFT_1145809, partial [Mycena vulgaris]